MSEYEVALAECSGCHFMLKLSFTKGQSMRMTYCGNCNKVVWWVRKEAGR